MPCNVGGKTPTTSSGANICARRRCIVYSDCYRRSVRENRSRCNGVQGSSNGQSMRRMFSSVDGYPLLSSWAPTELILQRGQQSVPLPPSGPHRCRGPWRLIEWTLGTPATPRRGGARLPHSENVLRRKDALPLPSQGNAQASGWRHAGAVHVGPCPPEHAFRHTCNPDMFGAGSHWCVDNMAHWMVEVRCAR